MSATGSDMDSDTDSPDFEDVPTALRRAIQFAGAIDQVPLRSTGWKRKLERAVKNFLKWLVHWNTKPQADFNRLLIESIELLLRAARSDARYSADRIRYLERRIARLAGFAIELATRASDEQFVLRIRQELSSEPDDPRAASEADGVPSAARIRRWIEDPDQWPVADSYDFVSLKPCAVLERREGALRLQAPEWFWRGEGGATMLSVGSGKAYFERRYWRGFDKVFVVDPSHLTYHSLMYYPVANVEFLGASLFDLSPRMQPLPKHAWFGACIHYLFGEFHGWAFMHKLAMMVSDTVVVDAGVFDADSPQGSYLSHRWEGEEPHEKYRRSQFNYKAFLQSIEGLWQVVREHETQWIADGRRSLVLKRILPPTIQRSALGPGEMISEGRHVDSLAVYRVAAGYFKESVTFNSLLMYNVVSRVMGWPDMVRYTVYDGDRYVGFVVKDYGDVEPDDPSVSESLMVALMNWSLPLGLFPADLARPNVRVYNDQPVWIDITLVGLREIDSRGAIWAATNTYKLYDRIPARAGRVFYE